MSFDWLRFVFNKIDNWLCDANPWEEDESGQNHWFEAEWVKDENWCKYTENYEVGECKTKDFYFGSWG